MLSITTPGVWLADRGIGDSDDARRLARDTNDHGAQLVSDHAGRFGMFASLPLPHIDDSLREIEHAFDVLKADGICLLTSFDGKWLGHAHYAPIFEELDRRRALVYVHPTVPCGCRDLIDGIREPVIEYGTDTTRAIASLIHKNAVGRYPNVRFVFSHGGGTMPFLIERLIGGRGDLAQILANPAEPGSKLALLREFYYDTAQAANPASMGALRKVIDPSHIVFGTDYPYTTMVDHVKGLSECGAFSNEELRMIDRENGLRLLPKYRYQDDRGREDPAGVSARGSLETIMNEQRPELGAALSHLSIRSADPARLAGFFEDIYGMTRHSTGDGWKCEAPGRAFLVTDGKPNSVAFFAYAFGGGEELRRYRELLEGRAVPLGPNRSPLFDGSAFSATDPDGNVVVFGAPARPDGDTATQALAARIQHLAFRTAKMEAMLSFYRDTLGFVLSDRVEDEQGTLRACFLRTDHEHHALALFGSSETRLDHISCETRDLASLAAWADRVAAKRVPLHWGVGRHGPGNDLFFMVKDPDDNLIEISAELERVDAARPTGVWPHEQRTLNLWGTAIMRS